MLFFRTPCTLCVCVRTPHSSNVRQYYQVPSTDGWGIFKLKYRHHVLFLPLHATKNIPHIGIKYIYPPEQMINVPSNFKIKIIGKLTLACEKTHKLSNKSHLNAINYKEMLFKYMLQKPEAGKEVLCNSCSQSIGLLV